MPLLKVEAFFRRIKVVFSLRKKAMKKVEMKKKRKKLMLGIYSFFIACLSSETCHPRGVVEAILCVTKWGINVSGEVKVDMHIHDFLILISLPPLVQIA